MNPHEGSKRGCERRGEFHVQRHGLHEVVGGLLVVVGVHPQCLLGSSECLCRVK